MPIERERKFILKYLPELPAHEVKEIKQAYLMIAEDSQLRIRLIDGRKAILGYKLKVNTTDRHEFEYEIPYEEGKELYDLSELKLSKRRYSWEENGVHIDLDIYPDEIGFNIVEIEFEGDLTEIPDFCDKDVSDDENYSNIGIARRLSRK